MQFIVKNLLRIVLLMVPSALTAQSTFLPQGHKHQQLLDRLDIKLQSNSDLNILSVKPITRRYAVRIGEWADSIQKTNGQLLTAVDQYNLRSLLMNNSEWVTGDKADFLSRKTFWNTFYKTKANLVEVNSPDFFLALNPVFQGSLSKEGNNNERVFQNTKGLTFRGLIAKRIGFAAYLTDNQERGPRFLQQRVDSFDAVPGVGFYKSFKKTATDYFDGRGSIHFNATKYLDFQFGYDKNFIGNGYRSLFLSDYGNSYLFLKINTRIWKLNYLNLFMELNPRYLKGGGDRLLDKKYAAIHHLSFNAAKWLNVGVFEAVVFGRKNKFDFTYLNPIMFLRVAEQQNGSADNALVGFDFKANIAKRAQVYGQLLLDEFFLKEIRAANGWWANKYGLQLGGKYIDVFSIKNLDIQGEINLVRPFTYSHSDSVSNYSHFNQPLAHPLGANFSELIGIVRYQPFPKWTGSVRIIYWKQGVDSAGLNTNFGSNIFNLNSNRPAGDYGYEIGSGIQTKGVNTQLLISYEWKENLYIEMAGTFRKQSKPAGSIAIPNATMFTAGLRLNMFRREYDY
ncbi:MAG: hypothetical protein ACKVOW_00670 [Chitinophagaceae bacterium]